MTEYNKNIVLAFLPVMKELELMGCNPLEFFMGDLTIEQIETKYVAISRAKAKFPEWYKVVSKFISKVMSCSPAAEMAGV